MKVVFLGTPEFAVEPLERISEKFDITAVVTQPDKPGNRGKPAPPPVKTAAERMGLPVLQFGNIGKEGETLRALNADVFVTAAYGQILTEEILAIPTHGVLNVHASLLPRYRGAAPVNWALIRGEKTTGVTIMRTVRKLDAGDIVLAEEMEIDENINAGELTDKLSVLGARLIVEALTLVKNGEAVFTPQDHAKATVCGKLKNETGLIDWSCPARQIHNLVRGLSPRPAAWTVFCGRRLKILKTSVAGENGRQGKPGEILGCRREGILTACGEGSLLVETVQYECCKAMPAADFANGRRICPGNLME